MLLHRLPALLLIAACTSTVAAEDYALEDERAAALGDGLVLPDGERIADRSLAPDPVETIPEVEPEPAPPEGGPPRIRVEFDPTDYCRPSFTPTGFPAIDVDAGIVVVPLAHVLQLSSTPGALDLVWFDASTGAEIERNVLLHEDGILGDALEEEGEEIDCTRPSAPVRAAVRAANRALRARTWVTMERLPVELFYDYGPETAADYREQTPVAERPVQVLLQHGHAIARVLGVKVLERHDVPNSMSMVHEVYAHRPSGTVVFGTRDCDGESCTCDPRSSAAILHWKPETFAAIDAHPCIVDPASRSEVGNNCDHRPVPFDDFDAPLWAL